jgi:hypothetical protein
VGQPTHYPASGATATPGRAADEERVEEIPAVEADGDARAARHRTARPSSRVAIGEEVLS